MALSLGIAVFNSKASKDRLLKFNPERFVSDSLIYRNDNDLSRGKLAKMLKVSPYIINSYETQGIFPHIEVVINFCQLTGNDVYKYFD